MGRKPGEPLVRIAEVEVVSVRREPLRDVVLPGELTAEGFPEWDTPDDSWARSSSSSGTSRRRASTRSTTSPASSGATSTTQSAAHMTDYIVDAGTVAMVGGANVDQLVKFCVKVGLLTKIRQGAFTAYKLVDDPEFIHIRLASEVEWERQQRADTSDLRLSVPVRARDGDLCRYCGLMVQWRGRTSTRKGTLDHLVPGEAATVATMVVACKGCNSELRDLAGQERDTLTAPPSEPFYSPFTAAWLTKNGRPTAPTEAPEQRPGNTPDPALAPADDSDPAPAGPRAPAATGMRTRNRHRAHFQ
jgi:hypothetical protein